MSIQMRSLKNIGPLTVCAIAMIVGILLAMRLALPLDAAEPPLGDCFSGALSDDPLNCYILEQAQEDEVIDIEAMCDAVGALLYVYLTQDDPMGDEVGKFFQKKAREFVERWPDGVYYSPAAESCARDFSTSRENCVLEVITDWKGDDILPYSESYENILVRARGAEARRSERGWASLRQVWPPAGGMSGFVGGQSGGFDVSDVDMTNFPEFPCLMLDYWESCETEKKRLHANIAGYHAGAGARYIQYKNPPKDGKGLEALEEILYPSCDRAPVCTHLYGPGQWERTGIASATSSKPGTPVKFHGPLQNSTSTLRIDAELTNYHAELERLVSETLSIATSTDVNMETSVASWEGLAEVEIIPVNFNYADLRRYEIILDRFVSSRGNIVGITNAELRTNHNDYPGSVFWTSHGPGEASYGSNSTNASTLRETVAVYALDAQTALNALPELLPALGIPLDAVGVVVQRHQGKFSHGVPEDHPCDSIYPGWDYGKNHPCGTQYIGDDPALRELATQVGVSESVPFWLVLAVSGLITLFAICSMIFTTYRMTRALARMIRAVDSPERVWRGLRRPRS